MSETQGTVVITGELRRWHKVTLTFDGPDTSEDANDPNPFLDYRLNVTFTKGSQQIVVPGYYAADGNAAETSATSGNKWRVHFMPDETGTWTYTTSFRTGTDIAVSLDPNAGSSAGFFDGATGTFDIQETDKPLSDFRGQGLLRHVGGHHMQFAGTGEYYLKGGADSPENFLGYFEFDGTSDEGGIISNFLHEYAPHASDWQTGDPTWQGDKGKNIIGAINYLASQGVNSVYFITYNLDGGDGRDTWPWTADDVRDRFDVSKLDQWEIVFAHMTRKGIQLHVVTQETENDEELGGDGSLNTIRKLYYRELIARFAHHPVMQWNLGEENDNLDAELASFSEYIGEVDPYAHPVTVHTYFNMSVSFAGNTRPGADYYDTLLQNHPTILDATSIQGSGSKYNEWAQELRNRSTATGHPWVIYGDEQGPAVNKDMNNVDQLRQEALWGNLMGGGAGVEWYFGYDGEFGDVQSEDFRVAQPLWEDTAHALNFFHSYLPFWQMQPDNSLSTDNETFVLAQVGAIYAMYTDDGTPGQLDLGTSTKTFNVKWYDPRNGGALQTGSVSTITGPGLKSVGDPPSSNTSDWAVLVSATDYVLPDPSPPNPTTQSVTQFALINAETDTQAKVINNGATLNLPQLGVAPDQLNIRADTNPATIGSVVFTLNSQVVSTDNAAPYTLFGDNNADFNSGTLNAGNHTLTAVPHTGADATGTAGQSLTIEFSVITEPTANGGITVYISPEGLAIPVLTWQEPTPPGDWYQVLIMNDTGTIYVDEWFAASDICSDGVCSLSLEADLPFGLDVGTYDVKLNVWSDDTQITTQIGETEISVSEEHRLVQVIDGLIYVNIYEHAEMEWMRVWIGTPFDYVEVPHLNRSSPFGGWYEKATEMSCSPGIGICTFFVDAHPVNGDYVAYFQEWDGTSLSDWSGPFYIEVDYEQPQKIQGLTFTKESPIRFQWDNAEGGTWYQIWVGTPEPEWETAHMEWYLTTDLGCDDGTCGLTVTDLPDTSLVWYVRGWGPGGFTDGIAGGWTEGKPINGD